MRLCPWDSLSKNTGEGCHALFQRIFATQGLNQCLLHCRWILYHWATGEVLSYLLYASLYLLSPNSMWFSQIRRKRRDSVGNDMGWVLRMLSYRCLWASGEVKCRPSDTWLWRAGWGPGWETPPNTHTHIAVIKGVGVLIAEWTLLPLKTTSSKQMTESKGLDQPLPSPISDPYIFPYIPRAPLWVSLISHS